VAILSGAGMALRPAEKFPKREDRGPFVARKFKGDKELKSFEKISSKIIFKRLTRVRE
jgi:hypothetical protein